MNIPESIKRYIDGKQYELDDLGKSDSKIMLFDDMVLKIEPVRAENETTVELMKWLEDKVPAPKVIVFEKDDAYQYLLMTRVKGDVLCATYYLEHPKELLALLASAFKMLWNVDVAGCPRTFDLDAELAEARRRVENNLVDISDTEPDTFGEGGRFKDPYDLLSWLEANKPSFEPVFSHGDLCLPNILVKDGKVSGFSDLGDTGVGDKWKDIALGYRSLKHNFDGTFGGKVYPDFDPEMLWEVLGIEPDREKIDYFILLDELF